MEAVSTPSSATTAGRSSRSIVLALLLAIFLGAQGTPDSGTSDISSLLALGFQAKSVGSRNATSKAEPFLIRLRRIQGPSAADLASPQAGTGQPGGLQGSFYVGSLYLGSPRPQQLRVSFDTASGQVVVPSSRCHSLACSEHRRFAPRASSTAQDINSDGRPLQLTPGAKTIKRDAISIGVSSLEWGSGRISGDLLYEEQACFGGPAGHGRCIALGLVAATEMSDVPFRAAAYDGTVGLGLAALSSSPLFHALTRLESGTSTPLPRSFGLYLGATGGELALGGFNAKRLASPLLWAPVIRPEDGYWQVAIRAVRVGNTTLACSQGSGCRGIIDSLVSGFGISSSLHTRMLRALRSSEAESNNASDGRCQGPALSIEVEGVAAAPVVLTWGSEDYSDPSDCLPRIVSSTLPEDFGDDVIILGQAFLQRYYTVFDWGSRRLGFGLPAAAADASSLRSERRLSGAGGAPTAKAIDRRELSEEADDKEDDSSVEVLTTAEAEELESEMIQADILASEAAIGLWPKASEASGARSLSMILAEGLVIQALVAFFVLYIARAGRDDIRPRLWLVRSGSAFLARLGLKVPSAWSLGSMLLAASPVDEAEAPEAAECSVCLGVYEEDGCCSKAARPRWCKLNCGHSFHQDCIFEWLGKAQSCPVCRRHVLKVQPKPSWGT